MITATLSRVAAALLMFITATACGPTGPDGSGGAGGATFSTTAASSSTSTGVCPGPGTTKTGGPCSKDCECQCMTCGVLANDAGMTMICAAGCEPVDGGS